MPSELEVLIEDEGNLLARVENVIIQVRTGVMNVSVLDRMESAARLTRASASGAVGGIAVVEEGAELASSEVRARQAQLVRSLLADPRTYMVSVVLGQSVGTRAIRTVMRLLLIGAPRLHAAGSIEEGVDWLAERVDHPSRAVLRASVDRARTLARR